MADNNKTTQKSINPGGSKTEAPPKIDLNLPGFNIQPVAMQKFQKTLEKSIGDQTEKGLAAGISP